MLGFRPLVIESFNDATYPFNRAEECDAVLCASPNIVLQFETSKYFEAIKSYGGEKSKLQLTVSDIYASSLVKNRFLIQPLNSNERNEPTKLTRNYSRTIEKLKKTPEAARLFGASKFKLWECLERHLDYKMNEKSVTVNWTFEEVAEIAEHLKHDLGIERALFIIGG